MFWIIPAWVVSCIAVFLLGYYLRGLSKKVAQLEQSIKLKADKQVEPEEPTSNLIDPDDPIQTAIYEHNKMMEKLNGK